MSRRSNVSDEADDDALLASSMRTCIMRLARQLRAERGDETALERLDRELATINGGLPRLRAEVLLPARALRAGWSGDFKAAYDMLAGTAEQQGSDERRAVRACYPRRPVDRVRQLLGVAGPEIAFIYTPPCKG